VIRFVFRSKRRVNGKLRIARTFTGEYRLTGDKKPTRIALGVSDRQVAEEKLSHILREAERERVGLIAPKAQRDALKQSVEAAVQDYITSRRRLHRDEKYIRELELKLLRLMRECNWRTLGDIRGGSFEAWRARQPRQQFSAKTLNEYHAAVSAFCKWLELRLGNNPMRSVERIKAMGDPRRRRRAFTPEELWRLVSVSDERGIVYLIAAFTGFRRGELAGIQWRDVHIYGPKPYILVRSSIAKNARRGQQPLPLKLADILRRFRPVGAAPHDYVFRRFMPDMDRFRADLKAADITYIDEKGEYADFHSLRKTLATELAKSQVPLRVAMELMRHSDVKLTTKIYTDANLLPIWDAVGALPMFDDTQIDTQKLVAVGQSESLSVAKAESVGGSLGSGNEEFSSPRSTPVVKSPQLEESAPCRNRTCNPLIKSQLLCQLS